MLRPRSLLTVCGLIVALAAGSRPAASQTISGVLVDAETRRPIPIGLVMMFTERGDSITATMTDTQGHFSLSSPRPGDFVLHGSALGYAAAPVGVFELGSGGAITVEYRLRPKPLPIDELVVSLDRPYVEHHLVRNGFVSRFQRGLGLFVTPYQIERSTALTTEGLLAGLPGLRVGPAYSGGGGVSFPRLDIGEAVQIAGPNGWCMPTLYLDGARVPYTPDLGVTLSSLVDRRSIEAIEIYRRPAEIPVEYSLGNRSCGLVVAWSKTGLAAGQRPEGGGNVAYHDPVDGALPEVRTDGDPPTEGERIRMSLDRRVAAERAWTPPWHGVFIGVANGEVLTEDLRSGRTFSVPIGAIEALQVQRRKGPADAYRRGAIAGAGVALFTRIGLGFLCAWSHCGEQVANHWIPAGIAGVTIGAMVVHRGPGTRWESTTATR